MRPRVVLLVLTGLSGLAYGWPRWFGAGFDPFLESRGYLWALIAGAMFAIGWLLPLDEARRAAEGWRAVLGGAATQYGTMPLLAFGFGWLLAPDADALLGILLVGCVPGAMASNVLTLLARGNVGYSVSLTTTATLVSPLAVPLALKLTTGRADAAFPAVRTMGELFGYVVAPVVAGHLLGRRFPGWRAVAGRFGPAGANLAILWIIAVVVASNRERLGAPGAGVLGALLGINVFGYLAGNLGARAMGLPGGMRRALTLEVGMQNAGLGTTLALSLFPDRPAAAIPGALYTFGCMLSGTLLAQYWGSRPLEGEGGSDSDSDSGSGAMDRGGGAGV